MMCPPVSRENFPGATGIVGNVEVFDTKVTNGDCIHQMERRKPVKAWLSHENVLTQISQKVV